jgi:beta-glucosidase
MVNRVDSCITKRIFEHYQTRRPSERRPVPPADSIYVPMEFALAFVLGAQWQVMATAKHFAVNSIENTRLEVDVTVDQRTLREVYLPHFARVLKEGHVAAVMTAYNSVNGANMSENEPLIAGVLRSEWGFYGYVMSD